jgi:hypothetical protein
MATAWIARAASCTQWKPRLPMCMISPQPLISCTARKPWSMRMLATRELRSEKRCKAGGIGFRVAMRPGKRRVLPDTPEGRLDDLVETAIAGTASACSGAFPRQRRTSISCDQTAVRLSEDLTAGNAQKPLQNECAGRPLEPINDTSQAAMQFVIGGLVWPLRARIPRISQL